MSTTERRSRRAPTDADRRRDPERTRERIIDAAVAEFGDHGYAGARVGRIAKRAGVNAQLISYYFDGKAGLYQVLLGRWHGVASAIIKPDQSIEEITAGFVRAGAQYRSWSRLLAWEALDGSPAPDESTEVDARQPERTDFLAEQVADLRRRQAAGEFPADIDPAHLLLALFAISNVPNMLPRVVRRILGTDPDSAEFRAAYADQVTRIVRYLTGTPLS